FFSSRRRHTRLQGDWSSDVCSSDLVRVNPNDIVVADDDGVAVVPREHAADVLKKAQQLDNTEHSMMPFIEKFRSIKEAVAKFGRSEERRVGKECRYGSAAEV